MNLEEVIKEYGSIARLAKSLKVSRGSVYRWMDSGIPVKEQALIEIQTSGKFKLDRRKARVAR